LYRRLQTGEGDTKRHLLEPSACHGNGTLSQESDRVPAHSLQPLRKAKETQNNQEEMNLITLQNPPPKCCHKRTCHVTGHKCGYRTQEFVSAPGEIYICGTCYKKHKDGVATPDPVNHPPHYKQHPSGVECITITEHMGFNLGNAVKYIWRADLKGKSIEDLKKAEFYIKREIARRQKES
jgi:hypothetical protein